MHILTVHALKRLLRSFQSKIWLRYSLRRPRSPMRQLYFHYRVTFTGYIRCFCATVSHDLATLTFDLLTLRVFHSCKCFSCPPTYNFLSYDYRLLSYEYWIFLTHFCYLKQSVRMRRVTWPLTGRKNSPYFWNPWPKFVFTFLLPGRYDED